jgi:hypothetical protein
MYQNNDRVCEVKNQTQNEEERRMQERKKEEDGRTTSIKT